MVGYGRIATFVGLMVSVCGTFAFVAPLQARRSMTTGWEWARALPTATAVPTRRSPRCRMEVELEQVVDYITGKRLEAIDEAQGVYNYQFSIEAPGSLTSRIDHRITRAVKERIDFPGHMKGQIPANLVWEVHMYVVEEILNDGILTALESYGLVSAYGEGTEADLKEEMKELLAVFKAGKPLPFSCTIHAKQKPDEGLDQEGDAAANDATAASDSAP